MRFVPLVMLAMTLAPAASAQTLVMLTRDGQLKHLDSQTFFVSNTLDITVAGDALISANGMVYHPKTQRLLVALRLGAAGPVLADLDPATAVATVLGPTATRLSGLALGSDDTLYGISGDGASTPETLYTISQVNGALTEVLPLGNGDDGEAIAAGPEPGVLYHASGLSTQVFEQVDPEGGLVTDIPGAWSFAEVTGLGWSADRDAFLLGDIDNDLWELKRDGTHVLLGANIGANPRGFAYIEQPHFLLSGGVCPGTVDILFTGLSPGGQVGVMMADGLGNAAVPAGPCAGEPTILDAATFSLLKLMTADGAGAIALTPTLPGNTPFCGALVQAVDVPTCRLTNGAIVGQ